MAVPRGVTYTLSDYRALGPPFPGGYILAFRLFSCQLLDPPFSLVFSFFQSSNVFFYPRGMVACNFNLLHFSFVVLFAVRHRRLFFFSSFPHFLIMFYLFAPFLVSCSSLLRGGFLHAAGFLFSCCFLIAASVEVRGIVAVCLFKVNRGTCYETFCKFQRP